MCANMRSTNCRYDRYHREAGEGEGFYDSSPLFLSFPRGNPLVMGKIEVIVGIDSGKLQCFCWNQFRLVDPEPISGIGSGIDSGIGSDISSGIGSAIRN